MNIFYQSNLLIINLSYKEPNEIINTSDYTVLKCDGEIVGINIFKLDNFPCTIYGLIFPTNEIKKWINEKIKIDIFNSWEYPIVVAHVKKCDEIPNTHLHKCVITDGINDYNIVCGAKNITSNINIVLAKLGAILPSGMQIIPRKLSTGISNGMVCSYKELGIMSNESGIIILPSDSNIGKPFIKAYKNMVES